MADSLSVAMLVVLESLSPEQRAVLLLHDVFDYGYREIAEIVGKSEDNVRQLATRARRHVEQRRPRFEASASARDELARRFFAAVQEGEVEALEALLAEDVVVHGDGGGKMPALPRAISGRQLVARTLCAWSALVTRAVGAEVRLMQVNGQPGAMVFDREGGLLGVQSLEIADGQVRAVRSIINPDKLGHLGRLSELTVQLAREMRAAQAAAQGDGYPAA